MDASALFKLLSQNWNAILTLLVSSVLVWNLAKQRKDDKKVNKLKLRLEPYERRIGIYQEVVKFLRLIDRDSDVRDGDLSEFIKFTAEADFLFGPEIREYIDEIYSRALKLKLANVEHRIKTQRVPDYNPYPIVKVQSEQFDWLNEQLSEAKNKFRKYLDLSK